MAFFEVPNNVAPTGPPNKERLRTPTRYVGATMPCAFVLARSPRVAVACYGFVVDRAGFEFRLALSPAQDVTLPASFVGAHEYKRVAQGSPIPPDVFCLGVEFPDGRRASNLVSPAAAIRAPTDEPVLTFGAGGGGADGWFWDVHVTPTPVPPGPVTVACAWPAFGVPLTMYPLDALDFGAAADRSYDIWPDQGRRR